MTTADGTHASPDRAATSTAVLAAAQEHRCSGLGWLTLGWNRYQRSFMRTIRTLVPIFALLGCMPTQTLAADLPLAALDLPTARILAQNLIGADVDDDGHLIFGGAEQDLAPAMRLRQDFWIVEFALMIFCLLFGRGQSEIAKWARISRLVVVLLGISLTFWTIAQLLPLLAGAPAPIQVQGS